MSLWTLKPNRSSDFSFELRTPSAGAHYSILRKGHLSLKLRTSRIRYGSRNSNGFEGLVNFGEKRFRGSFRQAKGPDSNSPYRGSSPAAPASQSLNYRLLDGESDKCPPIGVFCELAMCLYTPNLNNLGAKSPIVSNPHRKYSRFLETRAGDRARSALRGVGRSLTQHFSSETEAAAPVQYRANESTSGLGC
jgi:hypothetical protein